MKQINTMAFQFKLSDSMKIHLEFHVSLLESYHASTIPGKTHKPPPPIGVDGEQKYRVEKILDLRISHHQLQYLVHWVGYDISECTWEPVKNLSNAMEKVKDYFCLNKLKVVPCVTCC